VILGPMSRKSSSRLCREFTKKIWSIRGAPQDPSGIEATNSELKRCHGLGTLQVRRKPRVSLSARLKVLAPNIKRYVEHLADAAAAASPAPACGC
jgi:hypothetical protein